VLEVYWRLEAVIARATRRAGRRQRRSVPRDAFVVVCIEGYSASLLPE
jgi:hypothetical protein